MLQFNKNIFRKTMTILIILNFITLIQSETKTEETSSIKPGKYIPELYGAHLGKYVPDDSGKYFHINRPYDGGYGDRGIKYVHDASGNLVPLSTRPLGPKDHLRFMLDFNYDNTGWQILNFEWLRDGDANYKYKYVNENQLYRSSDINGDVGQKPTTDTGGGGDTSNDESDVHIEGEYSGSNGYNYSYNKDNNSVTNVRNINSYL